MQRRSLIMLGGAAVATLVVASAFAAGGNAASEVTLAAPTGAQLVADKNTLLVDIRTPEEWQQTGVVEGALLVTYNDPDSFLRAVKPHLKPGQTLALICRSGNRTSRASRQIAGRIENPIMDVAGGMKRVVQQGYAPVPASKGIACTTC